MPLCPADEQMSSEFTPQVTKACGVFVILGLSTTFIRFGSSLFDMGKQKEQIFFMFVQSFTNGQIMGFGC